MKARLEAVLFDLGDTLVDLGEGRGSYEARLTARVGRVYDALVARSVPLPPRETFCHDLAEDSEAQYHAALRQERGLSIYKVMEQFFSRRGLACDDALVQTASEAYCTGGDLLPAALRPGALDVLRALHGWGLQLGVISNTVQPARFMLPALERRGIAPYIRSAVFSSVAGVAMPHPDIFRTALGQLGVAAANAVYVGDRLVPDIGGPQAIGMKGVLIEVGHRAERHDRIVEDARIAELPDLLAVLPRLFDVAGSRSSASGGPKGD